MTDTVSKMNLTAQIQAQCAELDFDAKQLGYKEHIVTKIFRQLEAQHQTALQKAYAEGLEAAAESIKEPIGRIVYDGWYKREWPVTSHGYQKVREACCEAIRALPNKYEAK